MMYRVIAFVLFILLAAGGLFYYFRFRSVPQQTVLRCGDQTVDTGSATVIDPCATVKGTVLGFRRDSQGNIELRIRPDSDTDYLLQQNNLDALQGALLVRLTCQNVLSKEKEYSACYQHANGAVATAYLDKVSYTGPVLINSRYHWSEMLPVSQGI